MAKPRYFISKDLDKLENAHVCFRYWSGRVIPSLGAPVPVVSVIRQKVKKDLFAKVNPKDYIAVSDPKTGKVIYHYEEGFNEATLDHVANGQSESWIRGKLGEDWFTLVCTFIVNFAKKHHITAAVTTPPLITMALSKDDWKKVKRHCLKFEVLATDEAEKLLAAGQEEISGYGVDMVGTMLDREDKAGLGNCVELVEVDKTGVPLK